MNDTNNSNIININELSTMIADFYLDKDFKNSILSVFTKLCKVTNIDKMSIIAHNSNVDEYIKMYDYDLSKDLFTDYTLETGINVSKCINVLYYHIDSDREKFRALFNSYNYIHTDDYVSIKDNLKSVGFVSENEVNINEVYIFLVEHSSLFTYCVFEKYNNSKLSQTETNAINAICQAVGCKLTAMVHIKEFENEISMKEVVLEREKVPMAVIEENTNNVLYFNNNFKLSVDDIKIGDNCSMINNYINNCCECPDEKNVLIDTYEENNQQWIRKVVPFEMSNNKKAYMIYSKNSTDYLNQINAVDKLTQALLSKGFEEYYKSFVQRNNDEYALCTLDIDKFKYINTVFGYETGDDVLKKVSAVINSFIDSEENFCRLGGDKFSIFLHYLDDVDLHIKLRKLAQKFEDMRAECFPDARITIIGGVTLVDKSLTFNTLLDQSTMARKSAKGSHKNKFSYYNVELDLKLQKEIQIEEQIPHALANNEFVPFLQPKFDLKTKKICGAEALVRWITPKGMIFPDQFIPLFEKNGFILTLDFIIYNKVMEYIRKCLDENLPVYPVSVNVSRNHINDGHFIKKFMKLVDKYNVPHEYLELEVTESVFVEDRQQLKEFIDNIKSQNLKVSIDDFGTAYSSLQTLTDINVDILKIDKGFLDNITPDENSSTTRDEILIKNIINLAKELNFKVICEGVETDEQVELLKNIGCELGQGYVFAKPMSICDYEKQFIRINI